MRQPVTAVARWKGPATTAEVWGRGRAPQDGRGEGEIGARGGGGWMQEKVSGKHACDFVNLLFSTVAHYYT